MRRSADARGIEVISDATSGDLHDAAILAAHVPTAMLFVPSRDGISHSPDEFTRIEDIATAATILMETVRDRNREGEVLLDLDRRKAGALVMTETCVLVTSGTASMDSFGIENSAPGEIAPQMTRTTPRRCTDNSTTFSSISECLRSGRQSLHPARPVPAPRAGASESAARLLWSETNSSTSAGRSRPPAATRLSPPAYRGTCVGSWPRQIDAAIVRPPCFIGPFGVQPILGNHDCGLQPMTNVARARGIAANMAVRIVVLDMGKTHAAAGLGESSS